MKKGDSINPRVWKDTGGRVGGLKLYISVLGHYALEIDSMYLVGLTDDQEAERGQDVNKSGG